MKCDGASPRWYSNLHRPIGAGAWCAGRYGIVSLRLCCWHDGTSVARGLPRIRFSCGSFRRRQVLNFSAYFSYHILYYFSSILYYSGSRQLATDKDSSNMRQRLKVISPPTRSFQLLFVVDHQQRGNVCFDCKTSSRKVMTSRIRGNSLTCTLRKNRTVDQSPVR